MAIVMMTREEKKDFPNVRAVYDYHGAEAGRIQHGNYKEPCPYHGEKTTYHETETCSGCGRKPFPPLYMETTHEGLVLGTGEYNGYDDSDFYATVWNWEKMMPERVTYASTRGWTYPNNATVDATPEVLAAYEAFQAKCAAERAEAKAKEIRERCIAKAKEPVKGCRVKVVKGRKVPKGTEGECIWVGHGDWGPRVGIKDAAGTVHWTAASNVEAMDWETVLPRLLGKAGL